MKLFFIRHGNAEHNLYLKINESNTKASNLTKQGKLEALESAQKLKEDGTRFNIIYCSPLIRCRQTANIINKEFKDSIPIRIDERLNEFKTGFDNKSVFLWSIKLFLSRNRVTQKFGEGQSIHEALELIKEFCLEIEEKHPNETVLIVSHLFQFQLLCHYYYNSKIQMPWAQNVHLNTGDYYQFKPKNQSNR